MIPEKKLNYLIDEIKKSGDDLKTQSVKILAFTRYYQSNIPISYWDLKMEKDFYGDPNLLKIYTDFIGELPKNYNNGTSMCLASSYGRGKTLALSCILKKCAQKNYSCLYTTLSDMVSALTQSEYDQRGPIKRELCMVDFLVIDEVDVRYWNQSESSNEFFARSFEIILRTRFQNNLSVLCATNSPNIKEGFASVFKESLGSIMAKMPITFIQGEDFRKKDIK